MIIMGSIVAITISLILFFVSLGFMLLIGNHILAQILEGLPQLPPDHPWAAHQARIVSAVQLVMTFLPGALLLFAFLKLMLTATGGGRD